MPKVPLGILAPPKCLSFHSFLCIPFLTRDCVTQLSRKLKHDYVFLVSVTLVSGERLSSAQVHIHFNDGGAPGGQYALHYKRFGRETEEIIYKGVAADDETGTAAKKQVDILLQITDAFYIRTSLLYHPLCENIPPLHIVPKSTHCESGIALPINPLPNLVRLTTLFVATNHHG